MKLGIAHKGYFDLRNSWSANFHTVAEVVQELEAEYKIMKEKGVPKPILDKRDRQIETLIEFYNLTEQMLKVYDENLKDYRESLKTEREHSDMLLKTTMQNLQYMVKHFKNKSDGIKS